MTTTKDKNGDTKPWATLLLGLAGLLGLVLAGMAGFLKYKLDSEFTALGAQNVADGWSLALTMVAWGAGLLAAGLAAAFIVALRQHNTPPLRA